MFKFLFTKQASGTPHTLCLDKTQSGRVSIIEKSLFLPDFGYQLTNSSIDFNARSLIVFP